MYFNNINRRVERFISPMLELLHKKCGLTPNAVSIIGFGIGTISVGFVLFKKIELALLLLLLTIIFDGLDGTLARKLNLQTKLGEKLELFFDRINEIMWFLALVFIGLASFKIAILAIVAILLITSVREKSKFDPGFKRTILFIGYLIHNFEIALALIFIANLAGFVASLVVIDYKHQKVADNNGIKI